MNVFPCRDQLEGNFCLVDEAPQGVSSINAQNVILTHLIAQGEFDGCLGLIREDGIDYSAMPIPGYKDGDLFAREPRAQGLATSLPCWPGKLSATLEGFQEVRFIRLGNPLKFGRLVTRSGFEEAVTPPEGGGYGNTTQSRSLPDAQTFLNP